MKKFTHTGTFKNVIGNKTLLLLRETKLHWVDSKGTKFKKDINDHEWCDYDDRDTCEAVVNELFYQQDKLDQVDYVDDGKTIFDAYLPKYGYLSHDEVYLMQRTALRSINDEPIYNHMIVKDTLDDLYEVDMFDYNLMAYLGSDNLEIVGNLFQSHELLELCK